MHAPSILSAAWWHGLLETLRHGTALPNGDLDKALNEHSAVLDRYQEVIAKNQTSASRRDRQVRAARSLAADVLRRFEEG